MARVKSEPIRLNKYIASSGLYSRRQADKLVIDGFVTVNNEKIINPATRVSPNDVEVKINGQIIKSDERIFVKFYKPKNVLTAYGESRGRKTLECFPVFKNRRLAYSGRLDYESEGLLLLTNIRDIIHRLQSPLSDIEKEYTVITDKNLNKYAFNRFSEGNLSTEYSYRPCKINIIKDKTYKVILTEGKNRQIRNMFDFFNVKVIRLIRKRIGSIELGILKPGEHKILTNSEIRGLFECLESK